MSQEMSIEELALNAGKEYRRLVSEGYIVTLNWHDISKHDFLIVADKKKAFDVYASEAKGQTPYELIQLYGGVEGVEQAYPSDGNGYGDFTSNPEIINEESLQGLADKLNAYLAAKAKQDEILKKAKELQEAEKEKGAEGTGTTGEGETK